MDNNFLFYVLILVTPLTIITITMIIFTSLFMKNKKHAFVYLFFVLAAAVYQLIQLYNSVPTLGTAILVIYLLLFIITFYVIRHKRKQEALK
ncbi:hypothetical protein EEX84_14550 [Planococcus salinus]|uniref:Uncharacterized protein n=1 Tax=Planococcus salinus TaxID=1848460 RepID=A0A3M8P429_9BACL|nr:hypothetical protein EEX84_14550 [Planococcus salinus]